MRSHRIIAGSILALLAGATFIATHFWSDTKSVETELGRVARDLAAAKVTASRLNARLTSAEQEKASLQAADAGKEGSGKGRSRPEWLELLHKDPVVQARFLAYQKSGLIMEYGPLFREMHLSPEQVAKCEAIVIQRREAEMDLAAVIQDQGLTSSDPAAQKMYSQIRTDYQSSLTDLLGEAGSKQFSSYEEAIPARSAVAGLAGAATMAGIPLSSDQFQQLTAVAMQTRLGPTGPDWNTVETQAGSILTPNQLELFKGGEFSTPGGYGSKYMAKLNYAITQADEADVKSGGAPVAAVSSRGAASGSP